MCDISIEQRRIAEINIVLEWLDEKAKELHVAQAEANAQEDSPELNRLTNELNVGARWFSELMEQSLRLAKSEDDKALRALEAWKAKVGVA